MGAVTKDEHPLAGQIGAIHRGRPPWLAQAGFIQNGCGAGKGRHLLHKAPRGTHPKGHGANARLAKAALQPTRSLLARFGVKQHVKMRLPKTCDIRRCRIQRGGYVHRNAHAFQDLADLGHIIAVAKPKRGGPKDVATNLRRARHWLGQGLAYLIKSLVSAKVFLALIAGQFQRDNRHRQPHAGGQAAGIILDQLGCARGRNQQRLGAVALVGGAAGIFEQPRGICPQIACLKGGIGDRRAVVAPLDHCKQQIGIGIALGRVQHHMHIAHARGHADGPDMGRAFVCP